MNNPLISVIIPVYNAEPFLPACLDSVLSQDYSSFEILVIDDGSTDNSAAIIDRYAAREPRIVALHQSNAGVSAARNRGLAEARGEYIAFVDADDRVTSSYLSHLLSVQADLMIAGISLLYESSGRTESHGFEHTRSAHTDRERGMIFADAEIHDTTKGPCNKLFKREIIEQHHLRFDPRYSYGEDHLFVLEFVKHGQSIAQIAHIDYLYIHRKNLSLSHKLLPYRQLSAYAREAYVLRQGLIAQLGIDNREYDRYLLEERAHLIYQSIYSLYTAEGNYPPQERWKFLEGVYQQDYDFVIKATRLPLIFRLMKMALKWKNRPLTDGMLLLLSRGKEGIKKHL
ncbi:glycosyl transferase family 2 [Barnesiella viscericola DSM 18177]|uniref:Glycosyl transferase family 2 n=1 Tax=Barnesiella viscericola DSM 18177 TaxID=880074 RepID=W0ET90_9BACT|nr:glycosyltransferase [Barnesiella viscericola]AHF12738.1 glycosyl transferase family 2 [Barnesiella viscericola DSM 18177]